MPIDIGRKQTIEEITNGRIKKKPREETPVRAAAAARPEAARKAGRSRR
jgi:hypothetical protein